MADKVFNEPILLPGDPTLALHAATKQYIDNGTVTIGTTVIAIRDTVATLSGLTSVTSTDFVGALTGNADTATKLATARNITLTGDVSGSASFDGSADVSIAATIGQTGDIIPSANNTYSLGSPTLMWKDVYVGPGSLYVNGQEVIASGASSIKITADSGQDISIQSQGTASIELVPLGSGTIQLNGTTVFAAGSLIRSSTGAALIFDDPISFSAGTGISGDVPVSGAVSATSFTGPLTGNASTASALASAVTIGMSGVTATATSFNGSSNITIPVTAVPATLLTGAISAVNSWALTGDVTSTAGSSVTTIGASVVSLAKMANLAANSLIGNSNASAATPSAITIGSGLSLSGGVLSATGTGISAVAADTLIGNNTGSTAVPTALTPTQVKSLLSIAVTDVSGLATVASTGSYKDLLNQPFVIDGSNNLSFTAPAIYSASNFRLTAGSSNWWFSTSGTLSSTGFSVDGSGNVIAANITANNLNGATIRPGGVLAGIGLTCISENAPIIATTGGATVTNGGPFVRQYSNNSNSSYVTVATSSLPASFTADLQLSLNNVDGIYLRSNWPGDNRYWPSTGSVDVSVDNSTWTTNVASWNSNTDGVYLSLASAGAFRYIRINMTGAPANPTGQTSTAMSNIQIMGLFGGSGITKLIPPSGTALQAYDSNGVLGAFLNTGPGGGTFVIGTKSSVSNTFAVQNAAGANILNMDQNSASFIGSTTNGDVVKVYGVGGGGTGYVTLSGGTATNSGYLAFYDPTATRQGYIGWSTNSNIMVNPEHGGILQVNGGGSYSANLALNAGASFSSAATFGSTAVATGTDLSKHINLWGGSYGFSITGSTLNYVTGGVHNFIGSSGVAANINCGNISSGILSSVTSVPVGYDVADTTSAHAAGNTINTNVGGAGAGGTLLFASSGTVFGYIKGYWTNGSGNGIGKLVFGTRAATTSTSLSHALIINEDTTANFTSDVSSGGVLSASGRIYSGWDSGTTNSISCSQWFRTTGATGLYCSTYAGGVYMTDTTYLRSYNNKAMAASDFVISSDENLKAAIRPFEFKGRLRPVNFSFKKDGSPSFGFIAQEVKKLYPEVVGTIKDENGEEYLQLSYPKLTTILSHQINKAEDTIFEQQKRIEKLEQQIALLLKPSLLSRIISFFKSAFRKKP